jgi:succinyl-CoA synthetase alpha subunit
MGHAGAIVSGGKGTAAEKIKVLKGAGIAVAETPAVIADTLIARMKNRPDDPPGFASSPSGTEFSNLS